jgi:hypothetical protein
VIPVASALLCALVGIYWLAASSAGANAGAPGFRILLGLFTAFWLGAAVAPLTPRSAQISASLSAATLGVALFAAVGPVLLAVWTRTDYVRFVWIIEQGPPCSSMGGGPGMLWVFGTSWLVAIAATVYATAAGLTVRGTGWGTGFGLTLIAATVLAMFPAPAVLAFALGCVF